MRKPKRLVPVSGAADRFDISAVADLLAVKIESAFTAGDSYTYEDARRTNVDEGWTYHVTRRPGGNAERVESMRLDEEQLSLAWLTATRRVDNEAGLA
jgi:hypothetical protein